MTRRVKTINYYTNETIKEYANAQYASMDTGDSVPLILNQCNRRGGTQAPQQNYYYRWSDDTPAPHKIIQIYDLDFELIGEYISIQEAYKATSIRRESIYRQLDNKLPLKERKSPSSGLYFKWKEVL